MVPIEENTSVILLSSTHRHGCKIATRYSFGRLLSSEYSGVIEFGKSCRNIFREIMYVKIIS